MLLLLVVSGAGCSRARSDASSGPPLVARQGRLVERLLLSGELAAERAAEIRVPDLGIQPLEIRWQAENGAAVKAGDSLFELDNTQLAQQLEERRVAVLQAGSRVAASRSSAGSKVSDAEFELERRRAELEKASIDAAIPEGLRSEEEYRRLQSELEKAERRVADGERIVQAERTAARAEVQQEQLELQRNQARLRRIEAGISQLALRAPQDGMMLLVDNGDEGRLWEPGDVVYPGQRLAILPDASSMIVRARLFDVDDGRLAPGLAATAVLDAHPERSFQGTVRTVDRIALQQDRDSSTRIFWSVIDLQELDLELMRPGMSVKVTVALPVSTGSPATIVPRESLDLGDLSAPRALLEDGSWVRVELGDCTPLECAVTAGLEPDTPLRRVPSGGR